MIEILEINKIYNMDCLIGMKQMPDNSIDLIVTDPPYKTTSRGGTGNSGGMCKTEIFSKGQVFKHNDTNIENWLPLCFQILKDSGHCYIMTNHKNLINYLNVAKDVGFHFIKSIIWDKRNKIMGQFYMSQFEYILFFRKGEGVKINNCGTPDILSIPNKKTKGEDGKNLHDTEKPVDLMKILIENSSNENEIVLDPFMGVGSTALACKESNRQFIGFELDKHYCDIANKRINNKQAQIKLF